MDKFLVAAPPCAGEDPEAPPPPPRRWHRWSRIAVELDGRIDARFRHRELRRLLDSYAEILQKGKTKFHALCSESRKGLTDLAFTSDDKSRLFASGLDGAVYMWDRRLSKTHCIELTALPESQFTSVKLNMDNRTVFGATRNGTIHAWDTRGGRASAAFQSHNEVQPLSSVKISTLLGKIASLKEQSNIVSSEILSIDFNPSCSYQLAFHLDDGWSGVLNVNTLSVSHLHCPPPSWL
ncbi:hypothetical protein ACQ4PT_023067 [Festuca glaucescens]